MSINPSIETLPAWISAGVRQVIPMTELKDTFGKAFEEVAAAVGRSGAVLVGPAYACYYGMPAETVDVEIGFGIDRVVDAPGLLVSEHPETRVAVATHVGPYDELERAYGEFMPWLAEQKLNLAEDMYEFYDSEPDVDPAATVTRMVFPILD